MATGPEHYLEAERMRAAADEWADADLGWKANLTAQERINQRLADLADAQVHATLAMAAATAMAGATSNADGDFGMHEADFEAWDRVAGVQEDDETAAAEPEAYVDRLDDSTPVKFTVNGPGDYIAEAIAEHDPRTCTECVDQYEAEQAADASDDGDENHYTRAQLDGEACTVCGAELAEGEPPVPSAHDFVEGQMFAHAACAESEA